MDGVLPVVVTAASNPAMGDLPVDRERLQGIRDLLDAWPARSYTDDSGTFIVADPWDDSTAGAPVWSTKGRLIRTEPGTDAGTTYNGYVVSTVPEDGLTAPVSETWVMPSGALAWGPPFGRRPGFYESPTLPNDRGTLRKVAENLTRRAVRRGLNVRVVTLPDPRVERGDVVKVVDRTRGIDMVGRVTARTLRHAALELTVAEVLR
jgi:hypothetical protein